MKQFHGLVIRALFVFATIALLVFKMDAQIGGGRIINVSLTVVPPYSTNAKDYVQQGNNVIITITNMQSTPQQVIVLPSVTGSNGVKAALRDTYQPPTGLLLGPNQVRVLTLNQLKAINSTVTPADIVLQNMTQQDYQNNKSIPEGTYTVCVTVKNFLPTMSFQEQSCATFLINSYDPPMILNPVDKSTVKPINPQFISFSWTPSGVVGKTRYNFKLIDLTATPVNNMNDAFENNNILPFYQQTNIITNNLVLDNSKPKLKEGNKYALRVEAYDPQSKLLYKNKGRSQVIVFTYKNELLIVANPVNPNNNNNNPQNDPPKGPCVSATKWNGTLKQVNKNGLPNGTNIAVGHFVMKNTAFTQSNGSYNGTGEILVHLVNAKVKVEFSGIKIGDDNRMFDGKITAKVVNNAGIDDAMSKQRTGVIETVPDMDKLMNHLEQNARKVSNLNPNNSLMDLPLHFDNQNMNIGLVGMIFEPTEAYINAVLNTPLPASIGDSYLLLSAKGMPIHPSGYATADMKLALAKDISIPLSDKLSLDFEAGATKTFATFDCNGFKNLSLNGALVLNRNIALPLDNNFNVIADNNVKVKAPFELKNITGINEFLLDNVSFDRKFAIPDANDFAFDCKNLSIDLSTTQNGNAFKVAYPDKANNKQWIGIYVQNITLYLPEGFKKKGGGRMTVSAEKAYVDKMGFTGSLVASGQTFSEGTLASWGIELNKIDLKVAQSKLTGGGIGGVISLPLGDNTDLGFFATVSKGDANGAKVQLKVETKDEIDANLFLAKIKLFEGSSIEIGKEDGKYFAKAILNGEIGIDINSKKPNSNVSRFDLPDIKFQELTIDGKDQPNYVPNFDLKFASLQNQKGIQAKIGGFELNLNGLEFKKSGDKKSAGLGIDLGLSLFGGGNDSKNGAGATTAFTIWAKHDGTRFKYDKASLDGISINVDLGVAKLMGEIEIYDEDPVYGNGFRGAVEATFRGLGVKVSVGLQFGRTLENKGDYKYWYFDAMADFGKVGLNIPGTAASIYGLGGGAYCNMTRSGGKEVIAPGGFKPTSSGSESGAPTTSGVKMTPQKGQAGFKAAVLFGITGSRSAFNGDLTFAMELNSSTLAVSTVSLIGHAYVMQVPENPARRDPGKAFLSCEAAIYYEAATNVISGNFDAHLNILDIVKGGGSVSFKFDMPDKDQNGNVKPNQPGTKWYIKIGQWTPGVDPFEDNARLHAEINFDVKVASLNIYLQGYFMVGNDLPSGLPPLPDKIYEMTKDLGAAPKKDLPSAVSNTQGLAFALGAGVKLEAQIGNKWFGAYAEAAAGFDVLISDLNAKCNGNEIGLNGWYAQGQVYAYITADIYVLKINVASIGAGAVFEAQLPNPTWVRGTVHFYVSVVGIEGHYSKTITRGTKCNYVQIDKDPFEGVKLIKSVSPAHNTAEVNPIGTDGLRVDFTYGDYEQIKIYNAFTENYDWYFANSVVKLLDKDKKELDKNLYRVEMIGDKGRSYKIVLKKTLEANTNYYIYAKGEITGENQEEEVWSKFTTGDRPAKFGMKDVYETYPLPNQRYFMKQNDNGSVARGFIALKQDLAYLSAKGEIYALFFENGNNSDLTGYSKVTSATNQNYGDGLTSKLYFDIPKELKNEKIYEIKLLGPDPDANKGGNSENAFGTVIFEGFYFKTSKYNSFKEKLNTFKVAKVGFIRHKVNVNFKDGNAADQTQGNVFHVPVIMLQGGEGLDGYEMFGYKSDFNEYTPVRGRLIYAHRESTEQGKDYLANLRMKYIQLNTFDYDKWEAKLLPGFTKEQSNFLHTLVNTMQQDKLAGGRPNGFPYEGLQYDLGSNRIFSSGGGTMFWMKDIKTWSPLIKTTQNQAALKSNEMITGPEGPLTSEEIHGGGGGGGLGLNNGLKAGPNGGGNNNDNKTKYFALMDYTPLIAAWDHYKWLNGVFKAAKNKGWDIWSTYQLTLKMGLPAKMPKFDKQHFYLHAQGSEIKMSYDNVYPSDN